MFYVYKKVGLYINSVIYIFICNYYILYESTINLAIDDLKLEQVQ
jgi:hypothetical protein